MFKINLIICISRIGAIFLCVNPTTKVIYPTYYKHWRFSVATSIGILTQKNTLKSQVFFFYFVLIVLRTQKWTKVWIFIHLQNFHSSSPWKYFKKIPSTTKSQKFSVLSEHPNPKMIFSYWIVQCALDKHFFILFSKSWNRYLKVYYYHIPQNYCFKPHSRNPKSRYDIHVSRGSGLIWVL